MNKTMIGAVVLALLNACGEDLEAAGTIATLDTPTTSNGASDVPVMPDVETPDAPPCRLRALRFRRSRF